MADEIPKIYEPAAHERRVTERWLEADAFAAVPDGRAGRYVIMMPLPNVTGALHMGHAMDNVMQDLLIRWRRMAGDNTLWMPGTDHAGIATQAVVEKRLFELEGKTRHDLGREALVARIWAWKDEYQARIIRQQQAMGCSCDWKRQRFTMDSVCARAVREAFFRLFSDGLIYRGDRLVNWDCQLQTAVSDDEIVHETVRGHFWHIRYPIVDRKPGEPEFVLVATTRPETMLGDTAVAVHPDPGGTIETQIINLKRKISTAAKKEQAELEKELDLLENRKHNELPNDLLRLSTMARGGRFVELPLLKKRIPLIQDEWADPALGTGCVKITPAHDPNDYAVWERHKAEIGIVNILNPNGTLNAAAGPYAGLDRFEARKRVVADLKAAGLLESVEDRELEVGHSDRSKTPIEPYLSKQWFVRMGDIPGGIVCGKGTPHEFKGSGLAQAAIDASLPGYKSPTGRRLAFAPDDDRYGGTYRAWLGEKRDWCISRQLWWGHRIPIWHAAFPGAAIPGLLAGLPKAGPEDMHVWVADDAGNYYPAAASASLVPDRSYSILACLRNEAAEKTYASALAASGLAQDPDVLDTWFSSALWPMSTLGWPDPATAAVDPGQRPLTAPEPGRDDCLNYFYPGSCLVTARDIITLWVARMMIMGLYLRGDVPFTDSFIHANIQDGKGERMSKSKGNGIDPEDIIEKYGTDAMRYVLCDMQTGTQDIRLPVQAVSPFTGELVDLAAAKHGRSIFTYIDPKTGKEFDVLGTMPDLPAAKIISERFETGRAFCTKLWNAARFMFQNLGDHPFKPLRGSDLAEEDRWILSRLSKVVRKVDAELRAYNPSAAVGAARDFFWGDLCDRYLEIVKPRMRDESAAPVARSVLALAFDHVLRLFHPFVPFITETLWERLNAQCPVRGLLAPLPASPLLLRAPWPGPNSRWEEDTLEADFELAFGLVRAVRDLRARHGASPSLKLAVSVKASDAETAILGRLQALVLHLANLESLEAGPGVIRTSGASVQVVGGLEIFVPGLVDPAKERERLAAKRAKLLEEAARIEAKLQNEGFVARAPVDVVEKERRKLSECRSQIEALDAGLRDIGS
ncbi:MAG: valine--tRNA ligase [Candidatus Aminicenantes bacterium]|nr:valine--tRNA ligase [Candidatus Aminicenantes bacterium]